MARWIAELRDHSAARDRRPEPDFAALLDSVRGIRWPARTAVRGGIPGAHTSRLRGTSAEFTEYRPYRQGDDLGRIDWKLFARSDRAYIRLSNDRAILPTTIVLDASASMAFPIGTSGKWRLASDMAIGLAAIAMASADPVGLIISREGESIRLPPRARRGVLHEMIAAVSAIEPGGSEPLSASLAAAARTSGRVVIISDFLGDADDMLTNAASAVAGAKEVHALHIVAAEEIEPSSEIVLVSDPESPDVRRPMTGDARDTYVSAFAAWRDSIAHEWTDAGISYTMAIVDSESPDHLARRVTAPRGARGTS